MALVARQVKRPESTCHTRLVHLLLHKNTTSSHNTGERNTNINQRAYCAACPFSALTNLEPAKSPSALYMTKNCT